MKKDDGRVGRGEMMVRIRVRTRVKGGERKRDGADTEVMVRVTD
jgi:hypothetical protein